MAVLAGRVAVVTGASVGIGAGLAMLRPRARRWCWLPGGKGNWPG